VQAINIVEAPYNNINFCGIMISMPVCDDLHSVNKMMRTSNTNYNPDLTAIMAAHGLVLVQVQVLVLDQHHFSSFSEHFFCGWRRLGVNETR